MAIDKELTSHAESERAALLPELPAKAKVDEKKDYIFYKGRRYRVEIYEGDQKREIMPELKTLTNQNIAELLNLSKVNFSKLSNVVVIHEGILEKNVMRYQKEQASVEEQEVFNETFQKVASVAMSSLEIPQKEAEEVPNPKKSPLVARFKEVFKRSKSKPVDPEKEEAKEFAYQGVVDKKMAKYDYDFDRMMTRSKDKIVHKWNDIQIAYFFSELTKASHKVELAEALARHDFHKFAHVLRRANRKEMGLLAKSLNHIEGEKIVGKAAHLFLELEDNVNDEIAKISLFGAFKLRLSLFLSFLTDDDIRKFFDSMTATVKDQIFREVITEANPERPIIINRILSSVSSEDQAAMKKIIADKEDKRQ